METNNSYQVLVEGFARLLSEGEALSPAGLIPPKRPPVAADAPTALIFAPHPDDEVIIGGLPLRLLRELKLNIVNVAVTLGSRVDRQAERWQELKNCCEYIGFGLVAAGEKGLEGINPIAREQHPQRWSGAVEAIAKILAAHGLRSSSSRTTTTGTRPTLEFIIWCGRHWALRAWLARWSKLSLP